MQPNFSEVRPEDLVKYGLIPEFIGRLPVVSLLNELDRTELVKVLRDTQILSKQYKAFLMELNFALPKTQLLRLPSRQYP